MKKTWNLLKLALTKLVSVGNISIMLMTACSELEHYNGKYPSNLGRFGAGDALAHLLQHFEGIFRAIGKTINWRYGYNLVKIQ